MDIFDITASALTAQRLRLDTISSNLANVNSTRGPNGENTPYRRKNVVFASTLEQASNSFKPGGSGSAFAGSIRMKPTHSGISMGTNGQTVLHASISHVANQNSGGQGVQVLEITEDEGDFRQIYDPSHPDADDKGYVNMPNVNVVTEMVDMISATRAYEANVTAMQSGKAMMQAALEL